MLPALLIFLQKFINGITYSVCKEFGSLSQNKCVTFWVLVNEIFVFGFPAIVS
jgi:hypothetical protein